MGEASEPTGYAPYLLAKRAIDERSLNQRVWGRVADLLVEAPVDRPVRVLEFGAGVGGMLERILIRTPTVQMHYTVVEVEPAHLEAFRAELRKFSEREGYRIEEDEPLDIKLVRDDRRIEIDLVQADIFSFLDTCRALPFDLIVAQAFLDLFDIEHLIPLLITRVTSGGGLYFPITFDGVSSWLPVIDAGFDNLVERLYHRSMDLRGASMEPSPRSHCGRHVVYNLAQRPDIVEIVAGGSDWIVCAPCGQDLPEGEKAFLEALLAGYKRELTGHPEIDVGRWQAWLSLRRHSIETGSAVFMSHQLDVFAQKLFSGFSRRHRDS